MINRGHRIDTPLSRVSIDKAGRKSGLIALQQFRVDPQMNADQLRWKSGNPTSFLGSCFFDLIRLLICIHLRTFCLFIPYSAAGGPSELQAEQFRGVSPLDLGPDIGRQFEVR